MYKSIFATAAVLFTISTGFAQKLVTGTWRGALTTSSAQQIPFNFEVSEANGQQEITIINGNERFKVTDISAKGDSVFIKMPLFDSEFKLQKTSTGLTGNWIKHGATTDVSTPFTATPNTKWRFFKTSLKPQFNVDGRWQALFGYETGRDTTVGEFKQVGQTVTGTFLTTTGDYRFLEGLVSGDSLYLSCFDGGHAYLFKAKIKDDKTITGGKFYSGLSGTDVWTAVKDANAKLPDAYSLTALKPGYKKLDFAFNDLQGNKVSTTDEKFKNKVVIVQILGSWCPNCMDETAYMVDYYKKYQAKGVEVIGLAYERTKDWERSVKSVKQLQQRFNITYPLLVTGYTPAKEETAQSLPALSKVVGFPTTIIIDKKGEVRKIHTGFSGPATGEHYTEFVNEFEKLTDDLLAE
ncbi:MAG: TlpA family protein disulfide reductase [Sphingobacteriaceae bacterium]|nr:MAG: TlpA family protein disulfide reductase [Sphingobacteriaceae bacterium]